MNRPPSSKDHWWSKHQEECGGTYIKIKEPEGYQKKGKGGKEKKTDTEAGKSGNIKELLEKSSSSSSSQLPTKTTSQSPTKTSSQSVTEVRTDFSSKGHVLGGKGNDVSEIFSRPSEAVAYAAQKRHSQMNESPPSKKMKGPMKDQDKNNKTKHDSRDTSSLNHNSIILSKTEGKEVTQRINIPSVMLNDVQHSSHTTPGQDVQLVDLTDSKETTQANKTSSISLHDDAPHGSSSQEQDDELIDLTVSKSSCPICGFSGLREELLPVHVELCLNELNS